MNEHHRKQILIVDDNTTDVQFFKTFLNEYKLANELMHISNTEDAIQFLLDGTGEIRLIVVGINDNSENAIELMRGIKEREALKYIPLVILTNFWGATEITATHDYLINALYFRPLKRTTCKGIIELAGIRI